MPVLKGYGSLQEALRQNLLFLEQKNENFHEPEQDSGNISASETPSAAEFDKYKAYDLVRYWFGEDVSEIKFSVSIFIKTKLPIRDAQIENQLTWRLYVAFQNCALAVQDR